MASITEINPPSLATQTSGVPVGALPSESLGGESTIDMLRSDHLHQLLAGLAVSSPAQLTQPAVPDVSANDTTFAEDTVNTIATQDNTFRPDTDHAPITCPSVAPTSTHAPTHRITAAQPRPIAFDGNAAALQLAWGVAMSKAQQTVLAYIPSIATCQASLNNIWGGLTSTASPGYDFASSKGSEMYGGAKTMAESAMNSEMAQNGMGMVGKYSDWAVGLARENPGAVGLGVGAAVVASMYIMRGLRGGGGGRSGRRADSRGTRSRGSGRMSSGRRRR